MLLDTCFLADFLRGEQPARSKIIELAKRAEPIATSSVCIAEISAGMKNYSEEQKNKARVALASITTISLTFELAWSAGQIASYLKKKGLELELPDCILAGTALSMNDSVLTKSIAHFEWIKELKVEMY